MERKSTLQLDEITLPATLNIKQIKETERSHETKNHTRFKLSITKAITDGSIEDMHAICLEIANSIKKVIHVKEKPRQPILVAIIPKSTYQVDEKTRDKYGPYYEYDVKGKHIVSVK